MKQWIKAARRYKGLTQEQLGERLGLTKGNISAWENGHHEASLDQITRIAEATGYPEPLGAFSGKDLIKDSWSGWPFEKISKEKIRKLNKEEVTALEAVLLVAATQLSIDIKK